MAFRILFLTAQHVLTSLQACSCNGSPCQVNGSCQQCTQPLEGQCYTGEEAYGAILGTVKQIIFVHYAYTVCVAEHFK